jgi:hypothetical protein
MLVQEPCLSLYTIVLSTMCRLSLHKMNEWKQVCLRLLVATQKSCVASHNTSSIHRLRPTETVSDGDRVALSSMKFASSDSTGASARFPGKAAGGPGVPAPAETSNSYMTASMDQMTIPLPPWAVRAGARREIYFDPKQAGGRG